MILGIDVSRYQGEMNWAKAAAAGAQFAFLRAGFMGTAGTLNLDSQWINNISEAPKWMPCGAYWYFLPQFNAKEQADYFISLIKDKPLYLPPVIDVEASGNQFPSVIKDKVKTFVYRVKEVLAQYCTIYTRASFWNPNVSDSELWEELDLWIARYSTVLDHPWGSSTVYKPRDWSTWQFWQWSADGNGRGAEFGAQSASIDIDRFNGTLEDLQKRYKIAAGGASNPSIASAFIKSYGKEDDDSWYITVGLGLA